MLSGARRHRETIRLGFLSIVWIALAALSLVIPSGRASGEVLTRGHSFIVYLPADADIYEVMDRLEVELGGQNWEVMDIQHLDMGMRKYGVFLEHKLMLACKSQYLAQAIEEDPYVSLIIPCRLTLFRESGDGIHPGRIVLGLADPVFEAQSVDIKHHKAAEKAAVELRAVLERIAEFYAEPQVLPPTDPQGNSHEQAD